MIFFCILVQCVGCKGSGHCVSAVQSVVFMGRPEIERIGDRSWRRVGQAGRGGCHQVYQDLSYDGILASQPGAWLVKKNMFYMHAITKFQKRTSY